MTPFAEAQYQETSVLIDVMDDLPDSARERLCDFLPRELIVFAAQVETLAGLIDEALRNRGMSA